MGIIFTGGRAGGNSFNDLALEGGGAAAEERWGSPRRGGAQVRVRRGDHSGRDGLLRGVRPGDLRGGGAGGRAEQRGGFLPGASSLLDASSDLENVASYSCMEQGGFLARHWQRWPVREKIDEKINDQKVIGFIGGVDNPLINHFAAGYRARGSVH